MRRRTLSRSALSPSPIYSEERLGASRLLGESRPGCSDMPDLEGVSFDSLCQCTSRLVFVA